MSKIKVNAASAAKAMEEKDLAIMQGKHKSRYETFDEIESGFLDGHCCYECYIKALKNRIALLASENNRLQQSNR